MGRAFTAILLNLACPFETYAAEMDPFPRPLSVNAEHSRAVIVILVLLGVKALHHRLEIGTGREREELRLHFHIAR